MPHVIIKMYSGRSENDKEALASAVTKAVTSTLGYGEASVSVAIEDVAPERWVDEVFKPDIAGRRDTLYKHPGYDPLK